MKPTPGHKPTNIGALYLGRPHPHLQPHPPPPTPTYVHATQEFGLFCKFAFVMSYLNSLKVKAASDPDANPGLTASSL